MTLVATMTQVNGFELSFYHRQGMYGCEIACDSRVTDDVIWELALRLMVFDGDGLHTSLLKRELDWENQAKSQFFRRQSLWIDPWQFAIRFTHGVASGKMITILSRESLQQEIKELFRA